MPSLKSHSNLQHYAEGYFTHSPERVAFDSLITDFQVVLGPDITNPARVYNDSLANIQNINPALTIGTYLSSRMVREQEHIRFYPIECLNPRYFSQSEFMPADFKPQGEPGEFVDYRQPVAKSKLITLLTNEAVRRKKPILYTDNWVHSISLPNFIPWKTTVEFMADLRNSLKAYDIKLYANIALPIGAVPDADIVSLASSTDGISLEMAIWPTISSDPALLTRALAQYKILKDKKVATVMLPLGNEDEAKFQAAFAMIIDHPLVNSPFWKANPEWHLWPDKFGHPRPSALGGDIVQIGTKLSRKFERGTIALDGTSRTVTVG